MSAGDVAQCPVAVAVDASLLRLEQVQGDGVRVRHLHELESFRLQLGDSSLPYRDAVGSSSVGAHEMLQFPAHRLSAGFVEEHPTGPRFFDPLLDLPDRQIWQVAGVIAVPGPAGVVVEQPSVLAFYLHVLEPPAAPGAMQQPAQVVVVNMALVLVAVPFGQDRLHLLEQFGIDKGWVLARIFNAPVGHEAEVVPVA